MAKHRKTIIITTAIIMILALTSCGAKSIGIQMPDGTTVEIETKDMSKEQVKLLEQVESGDTDMMGLMQSGLFTMEELAEFGLGGGGRMTGGAPQGMGGGFNQDYSSVVIEDLDMDGLSDEQVEAIESLIAGETTLQELIGSGIMTQQQLMDAGLIQDMTGGQMPGNRQPSGGNPGQNGSDGN